MNQVARLLTGLLLIAASVGVTAQVHRCKDATGKTHYSDKPCEVSGQSGQQIERQYSKEEIEAQREQAYEAQARKQERLKAEQEREWSEQRQRAMQPQPAPMVRNSENDWQTRKDLQNAQTSASSITNNGGRWDQRSEAQRAREHQQTAKKAQSVEPPPISPTNFTSCSSGFCRDNQGGLYKQVGPDFMRGPNGEGCHRSNNVWHCN